MGDSKKLMLIGWDAADWKIIHELVDQGQLPTIGKMIESGVMGNMRTLSPVLSPMLWTSIATGKRPHKHGIYGFTEPTPNGKAVQPMTNVSRRCKAIWNILNQNDMQSIVVGWWPSHPAEPINGVMVSDFFHKVPKKPGDPWKLMPNCVHPRDMTAEVAKCRLHPMQLVPEYVRPFVPLAHEIDQDADPRLSMVMRMICECTTIHDAAQHLLETQPWDFAAIYYDAIDHFCHGFMRYRQPQQSHISDNDFRMYQNVVTAAYRYHDLLLKKLMERAGEDTTFIILSDHGFHPDHLRPKQLPAEPAGPALEHRDYGIFIASGPNIKKDHIIHGASLLDVTPTILSVYGLPIGEDMDGQPLVDMFQSPPRIDTIESWEEIAGDDGQHPPGMVIDPSDSKEALEQLVALGYIEPPDEDSGKAISKCTRELDYNLARSYMDAGMHGDAIPLLLNLYVQHPLEFRFGIQLANCLRAMNRISALEQLIGDLNSRWRVAANEARKSLRELKEITNERTAHWHELKKIDQQNEGDPTKPKLARVNANGKPVIFDEFEHHDISKIKAVARGNAQTLDFLSASVASSKGDFETALEFLETAQITKSENPGFQFHVGIVYLGLNRLKDAERAFLQALEYDEFHPNALMGLCRTYVEMGHWNKAIDCGKQAIGLKYHFPVAHYFLGRAKYSVGDVEGAINSLKTALSQNPNFVEVHEMLGKIYAESYSDADLAKFHTGTARELAKQNRKLQDTEDSFSLPEFEAQDFQDQLPKLDAMADEEDGDFVRSIAHAKSTRLSQSEDEFPEVVIVSGLPRSGTSMMMQMLLAGGIKPHADDQRPADISNPQGYFEAAVVKQLPKKNKWVRDCDGQAIKVVAPLIPFLPQGVKYKAIFMHRDIDEILASQSAMLAELQKEGGKIDNDRLASVFASQMHLAVQYLAVHKNLILVAPYHEFIANPLESARKLVEFLGLDLNVQAMAEAVNPSLYRRKKP